MKTKLLILALMLALFLAVASMALANGNSKLSRWVLSGGASDSAAGSVTLHATLGQPVVGAVSSGEITLGQGYWYSTAPGYRIYLPLILRG